MPKQEQSMGDRALLDSLLHYIDDRYAPEDGVLKALIETARGEGMPAIQVSPSLAKFLALLVKISGSRRVLEIGTLAGYSAIWMARALPARGSLTTLEVEPKHAAVAKRFIAQAGLEDRIDLRLGPALQTLEVLAGGLPFDFAFIDANKEAYPQYLDWALRLVRPGGLIVADNVLREGDVLNESARDEITTAVQTYNDRVAHDPRLEAVVLVTRNGGGNTDGVSIARIREDFVGRVDDYHRE